jgi:hypothetical protein
MWQLLVVAPIVAAAVLYAAWALLPGALRLRLVVHVVRAVQRCGAPSWLRHLAEALEQGARRRPGACGDCGAPPPPGRDGRRDVSVPPRKLR